MASASTQRHSVVPPPLPPPPRDLPADYRATTDGYRPWNPTDVPSRSHARTTPEEDRLLTSPTPAPRHRSSSGGLGDLLQKVRSHDIPVVTSAQGHTMLRKQKLRDHEERLRLERERKEPSPSAPVLPAYTPLELDANFDTPLRTDNVAIVSNKPSNFSRPYQASATMPTLTRQTLPSPASPRPSYRDTSPAPARSPAGSFDTRTDALTGRYSTMSTNTVNSPRRMRRKKDPTPFNVLVMGSKSSGKTSLINLLKSVFSLPAERQPHVVPPPLVTSTHGPFTAHYIETDIDGSRVGLTLWDSQGLDHTLADLQVRETATFITGKFEETFSEESKVMRSPGVKDSHIHCVLLVLDPRELDNNLATQGDGKSPGGGALSEHVDLVVMKGLQGLTAVLPVVSKADTLTKAHMNMLKRKVWEGVQKAGVTPLSFLAGDEEDEDSSEDDDSDEPSTLSTGSEGGRILSGHQRTASTLDADEIALPFSVLTPDPIAGAKVRSFPWGTADPLNPAHCDFARLRDAVFSAWRDDLRTAAREGGYESWRTKWMARQQAGTAANATGNGAGAGGLF